MAQKVSKLITDRRGIPREFRPAAEAAWEQGWWIKQAGSGHLKWGVGDVVKSITSKTPGNNPRTVANTLGKLRRAGLEI